MRCSSVFSLCSGFLLGLLLPEQAPGRTASEPSRLLTLRECLAIGEERALPLHQARREEEIAREQVREVRAQLLPSLDARAQYTRLDEAPSFDIPGVQIPQAEVDTYNASLEAEQLVYSGGAVRAALRLATHFQSSASFALAVREAEIRHRVTRSFYEVLYLRHAARVAQEGVTQLEHTLEQAQLKTTAGALARFDRLRAEVALANERPVAQEARHALSQARRAFRDLMYFEEGVAFRLEGSLEFEENAAPLGTFLGTLPGARPVWGQAQADLGVARAEVELARSAYLPELRAFFNALGQRPDAADPFATGWDWGWSAGIRAEWSLYAGGARRASLAARHLAVRQAEDRLEDLRRQVLREAEQAWQGLRDAAARHLGARETVELAEEALAIARLRFQEGMATFLELEESRLALQRARLQRRQAQLAYHQAAADLCLATGLRTLPHIQEVDPVSP